MNHAQLVSVTIAGAILGVGLASCGDTAPDPRTVVLESVAQGVILPRFAAFADRTAQLSVRVDAFCAAPDADGLADAQSAWADARAAWAALDVFAFGPHVEFPERYASHIDFHPARPDAFDDLLAGSDEVTAASMPARGATVRGLPMVEYLLFEPGTDTLDAFDDARRCQVLVAVADDLATLAEELDAAWRPGAGNYVAELEGPWVDTELENPTDAMSELVNRMAFAAENLRGDALGAPLADAGEHPLLVASPWADRSLDDVRATVETVGALYAGAADRPGVGDLLRAREQHAPADAFERAWADVLAALDAIPAPLRTAVVTAPDTVQTAIDALGVLQRTISVDIAGALGTSAAFNENDGD